MMLILNAIEINKIIYINLKYILQNEFNKSITLLINYLKNIFDEDILIKLQKSVLNLI